MRALLWLGVRQYVNENEELIRDVYAKYNAGWQYVLDFDIADVSDSNLFEAVFGEGGIGESAGTKARTYRARQTVTNSIFGHYETFMQPSNHPINPPTTIEDWRSSR